MAEKEYLIRLGDGARKRHYHKTERVQAQAEGEQPIVYVKIKRLEPARSRIRGGGGNPGRIKDAGRRGI